MSLEQEAERVRVPLLGPPEEIRVTWLGRHHRAHVPTWSLGRSVCQLGSRARDCSVSTFPSLLGSQYPLAAVGRQAIEAR
jgi:hypothetical protein